MDAVETSCFFSAEEPKLRPESGMQQIETAPEALCDLYVVEKEGLRRVLKCLKEKHRGKPAFEALLRKEYEIGHTLSCPYICEV